MVWIVAGVAGLGAMYLLMRWFARANSATVAGILRWVLVVGGAALLLFLALRVGIYAALPLVLVLPLAWRRWGRFGLGGRPVGTATSSGQASEVRTDTLAMNLDHDSGRMDGTVLRGRFTCRTLSSLNLAEILVILEVCRTSDTLSVGLLESYLDRTHGVDWRELHEARRSEGSAGGTWMTTEEALGILGLAPGATPDDIKAAHRRLLLKLHPDQGGSTYLASKINQAKNFLLGA